MKKSFRHTVPTSFVSTPGHAVETLHSVNMYDLSSRDRDGGARARPVTRETPPSDYENNLSMRLNCRSQRALLLMQTLFYQGNIYSMLRILRTSIKFCYISKSSSGSSSSMSSAESGSYRIAPAVVTGLPEVGIKITSNIEEWNTHLHAHKVTALGLAISLATA